jgi:hypothetical protein
MARASSPTAPAVMPTWDAEQALSVEETTRDVLERMRSSESKEVRDMVAAVAAPLETSKEAGLFVPIPGRVLHQRR